MEKRFLRTASLIGEEKLNRLNKSTVAVFGIGGVGSYALEALVRSGVGTVYIYDNDTVAESNINRQLIALSSSVGEYKTSVAKKRCLDINPNAKIFDNCVFVTPNTEIPFERFDFVIDAVDNVTAKLHIISECKRLGTPVISVMGTGNKLDPLKLTVSDISETHGCPLARVMRRELKKRNITELKTVWSPEKPLEPINFGECRDTGRTSPGSMSPVPGTAGLIAASEVIKKLTEYNS